MNKDKNSIDDLFDSMQGQWDTEEPLQGHQERFMDRLQDRRKKAGLLYKIALPAAAAAVIMLGFLFTHTADRPHTAPPVAKVSPKIQQTEQYFASIIEKELAKVEKEDSPETRMIVRDALTRMDTLEKDYRELLHELASKGENKQLIHAMITNLQTRISFLEDVLTKIENIKKLKENYHENDPL